MLSKPGEARKASSTPGQRRRKQVAEENLDDVVRRLQRLPPNKACADCSSKLTQSVNLTHGTFVCMACSGVHREFNHKIKGIGHSSFTAEEVGKLRHPSSGNEAVNSHYLARYSSSDRMKAPQNNNDLQHLRSWIRTKYIDKYWCEDRGGGGGGGGGAMASKSGSSGRSSKSKGESSRRKIMPKAKESSPKPAPQQAPAPDPFGFDSIQSTSASAANDSSWDAFGGSTQNAAAFDANFGGTNGTAPAPAAAPSAPAPAFQPDFGNFNQQPQQPTMVALPPAGQTAQAIQQPSQVQQQAQPSFQANFAQAAVANQQQQMQQQPPQQQPGQMQQQGGFSDFSSVPQLQQQQPQMQQPQVQQQPPQVAQNGFATFSSLQPQMQMQTQPQTQMGQSQNTMQGAMPNHQGGFGQFPQQQQTQQPQMMQQQQSSNLSGDSGFANFSPEQQPQQPHQQQTMQQQVQPNVTAQTQVPTSQMNGAGMIAQPPQQQSGGMMAHQGSNVSAGSEQPTMGQTEPPSAGTTGDEGSPKESAPSGQQLPSESERPVAAVNPNAFQSADDERKSAFDAFDSLSLEPTPAAYSSTAASEASAPASTAKDLNFAPYREGQPVVYSNSDGSCLATIAKVHYDDNLHPYYTINLNGREKQTDGAHLSLPGEPNASAITPGNGNASMMQETVSMLQKLNPVQVMQVRQLVATMVSGNNPQLAPSSGHHMQMNAAPNQPQKQQLDIPMASMGGAPPPPPASAPAPMQVQAQHIGMGMNAPTAAPAAAQISMQPHSGFGMAMGAATAPSPSMPVPAQNQSLVQAQFSMQQQPNTSMQAQPMGMGGNVSAAAPTPPSGMPPPPPPAPASGQLSINESAGQGMGTGMIAPAAPPEPALPPVEKEGNPFDFY